MNGFIKLMNVWMALLIQPAEPGDLFKAWDPEKMNASCSFFKGGAASRKRSLWPKPGVWQQPWSYGTGQCLVGQDFIWFEQRGGKNLSSSGSFSETLLCRRLSKLTKWRFFGSTNSP